MNKKQAVSHLKGISNRILAILVYGFTVMENGAGESADSFAPPLLSRG